MSTGKELKEKLFRKRQSIWEIASDEEKEQMFSYANGYLSFLNESKTEREIVKSTIKMAREHGYRDVNEFDTLQVGDKVYYNNRDKSIYLAMIGEEKIENGCNIIGSHGDSPRLDLKPNPLYEDGEMAYFKTHYYGGIKKYQWATIPLSMHGVVVKPSGEKVEICIGEDENDPIFTITDLLIHLSGKQMEKKAKEVVEGEELNLLVGSIPYPDEDVTEKIKLNILNLLNLKYGITEIDFTSSEIELVPAYKARSLGFDQSLVAAYGQDDKVCVYTSLTAMMELDHVQKTAICIVSDKEEIGSYGNTGMESHVFDTFLTILLNKTGENRTNLLEQVFCRCKVLSADVEAGYDPTYAAAFEKNNVLYLGHGMHVTKYTGARGKSGASDANAEYVAKVRQIFENNQIQYQSGEMGKIDLGGGGTIAFILAGKGADVLDCGVPILSMHAPYEVASKADIYEAHKAYKAFWQN